MSGQFVARSVAQLASRQHGVVGRAQLLDLGLSTKQIEVRCRTGAWAIVWRGVYSVGHGLLTRETRWMAAVLACGPGAVLSHRSAAELWQLLPASTPESHVSVPTAGGRRLRGITVHRRPDLDRRRRSASGIPLTSPAQTIADTAAAVGRRGTERMVDQADRRRLCSYPELVALLHERRGQRGTGILGEVVASHLAGSTITRSHLEELFLALCRRERLPQPQVNVELERLTVDFYWPKHAVAVETDGWSTHRPKTRFQHDIDRGNRLLLAGILPLRFSYDDVARQPKATAHQLRRALGRNGWRPD